MARDAFEIGAGLLHSNSSFKPANHAHGPRLAAGHSCSGYDEGAQAQAPCALRITNGTLLSARRRRAVASSRPFLSTFLTSAAACCCQ
jgi:hypothetical protein